MTLSCANDSEDEFAGRLTVILPRVQKSLGDPRDKRATKDTRG